MSSWGLRRYQNPDGTLTDAGRKRYATAGAAAKLSVHNAHENIIKTYGQRMSKADRKKMNAHRRYTENKSTEEYAKEVATAYKEIKASEAKAVATVAMRNAFPKENN